jgi:hypothetical protein
MKPTLERLLATALFLLVAGVCLVRGIDLVRAPHRLAAHEERVWLAWAYPRSDDPAIFARVAALLSPGETVCLLVPKGLLSVERYRFMANYYLLDQQVAAVRVRGTRRGFPTQATVVRIDWAGDVEVKRGGD